ncbi:MAG: hypothetical protein GY839_14460 [candidate division Zixibacteria bacterium]|nr:hypothetical protein [candidate division Zixibacteria bacterium]
MSTQQIDVNETILIVVGSNLKSEEKDRPLAYWLQQQIDKIDDFERIPFRKCVVISDALFINDKIIQVCPTISIGGPGVNSLAAEWANELPVYICEENRYYIQYDDANRKNRVSIWGMDQEMTSGALNLFIEGGLMKQYLKKVWKEKSLSN